MRLAVISLQRFSSAFWYNKGYYRWKPFMHFNIAFRSPQGFLQPDSRFQQLLTDPLSLKVSLHPTTPSIFSFQSFPFHRCGTRVPKPAMSTWPGRTMKRHDARAHMELYIPVLLVLKCWHVEWCHYVNKLSPVQSDMRKMTKFIWSKRLYFLPAQA